MKTTIIIINNDGLCIVSSNFKKLYTEKRHTITIRIIVNGLIIIL